MEALQGIDNYIERIPYCGGYDQSDDHDKFECENCGEYHYRWDRPDDDYNLCLECYDDLNIEDMEGDDEG